MLKDLFQNVPLVRVLDFFVDLPTKEFSKADIARECKISWITAKKIFTKLEQLDIVRKTRQINRAQMYIVNSESPILKHLHRFNLQLASKIIDLNSNTTAIS